MSSLRFDVRMLPPAEPAAKQATEAARLLGMGDRAGAERLYRAAAALPVAHASSLVNLAAVGIGLGEWQAARAHAMRALQQDRANADAWVNLGAASWHAQMRRDAAQSTHRALELAPAMEAAALNLNLMYQAVGQTERARVMLDEALVHNAGSSRLQQARAEVARLSGDTVGARKHALSALAAVLPTLEPRRGEPQPPVGSDGLEAERERMRATMTMTCDRLGAAGIDHHLIGGVVLGIAREGEPFHGDKDIDLVLPVDADRERIAALFSEGFSLMRVPSGPDARRWCMGFTDDATGIGVDLFFGEAAPGGGLRINAGWPDHLLYDYPPYEIGTLRWRGRDWPVPMPLPGYLASNFGEDWRSPRRAVGLRSFDKRWFDTQVSCPGLVEESVPRAINLVLLRLMYALRQGQWEKALALCDQVLARGPIIEVEVVRDRLLAEGIG